MRRNVTIVVLLLMGLAAGVLFSGVLSPAAPQASGTQTAQTAPAGKALTAQPPVAAGRAPQELAELRDFAGKLETLFQTVANEVSPAVVLIEAEKTVRVRTPSLRFRSPLDEFFEEFFGPDPFERRQQPREREYRRRGLGSGCILDAEGHVLTNNHVVEGADDLTVTLPDGRSFEAEILGRDPETDLAVIKIAGELEQLPTLRLGNSDQVNVGQWVIAVGNPFGLRHTVSAGIISAVGRTGIGVARYESLIQTDAAINPGNSGGPLVNLNCEVIAINTAIVGRGGNVGIGFAIPVNMIRDVLDDLIAGRQVVRGYLGVYPSDLTPEIAEASGYEGKGGALVNEVVEGSPAEAAGMKARDIIVEYGGEKVDDADELRRLAAATDPGETVEVKVWRDGEQHTLSVTAGNLTAAVAAAEETGEDWLGLEVQTLTPEMAERLGKPDLKGVIVADVKPDSVAARVISPGDVIVSVNDVRVESAPEYLKLMRAVEPGSVGMVRVLYAQSGRLRYWGFRRPR